MCTSLDRTDVFSTSDSDIDSDDGEVRDLQVEIDGE